MSDEETPVRHIVGRVSLVVLLLLTPFIPLLLSLLEHLALGTNRVENFCRQIGIHDELSMIYEPLIKMIRGL